MSTDDHLFFDPGHSNVLEAAAQVASAVGGSCINNSTGLGVSVRLDELDAGAFLIGPIWENDSIDPIDPEDPSDREIYDDFPMLWSMRTTPGDEDFGRRAAMRVFERLATSGLGWPLVLDRQFGELIATYDVERGVREFPPGTRSDGTDEHLWR